MPQGAVYRFSGRRSDVAFVVQVSCSRLDDGARRTVVPLLRRSGNAAPDWRLTPHLTVLGEAVLVDPTEIASVRANQLRTCLTVLSDQVQTTVMAAVDEMLSRA